VRPRSIHAVHDTARAFGAFARGLNDIDATFTPAIARFHDFGHRVRQFERALRADRAGRARAATRDIDHVHQIVDAVRSLDEFALWARQPTRVVHNDAKPANLVHQPGQPPCVIDLDTIGPGRLGYDVGELVRSIVPEEATNAPLDAARIEAVWRGFGAGWRHPLEPSERAVIPIAGVVIATELATRYLTDHLNGDRYFALAAGSTNQMRARVQARRAHAQLDALDDLRRRAENLLATRP
jgi:Ser/Thr protein kinase RdoA (MazF antagonist)